MMAVDTFEKWLEELDEEARRIDSTITNLTENNEDCWKAYWEDGYTPKEALYEDWSND